MHPLLRLADEVSELGRRLEQVSAELRTYQPEELTRPIAAPRAADPVPPPEVPAPPVLPVPSAPPLPQPLMPAPAAPQMQPMQPFPAYQQNWAPPPPPLPPRSSLFETLSKDGAGSRVLAWIGGAVTLLGVVLLLVLAVQRGWLGPVPRVLGGAALGGALIGIGLWVHQSPTGRTGAFALAATGIAALYLDTIAATRLFEDMPALAGLIAALVVAVAGLLLAAKWDARALAIAVIIGCAVCAPIITDGFSPQLVAFLLMVQSATMPVQLRKNWSGVTVAAGIPPLLASVFSTTAQTFSRTETVPNAVMALLAMAVAVALGLISARHKPDSEAGPVLLAVAVLPALMSTIVLTKGEAVAVSAAAAGVMLIVWATGKLWPGHIAAIAGAATLIAGFQATAIAFDGSARSAILMGEATLLALLALWLRNKVAWVGAVGFGVSGGLLAVVNDVPPSLLTVEMSRPDSGMLAGAFLAATLILAISVLLPWVAVSIDKLKPPSKSLAPWLFVGVSGLYGAAGIVLCGALLLRPDRTGFLLGHVLITLSWTVAALVLLLRGIAVKQLRVIGLILVGAAVVKLVLFDLSALDGLARVAAFLGAGLILLAAGTRYARLVARQSGNVPS